MTVGVFCLKKSAFLKNRNSSFVALSHFHLHKCWLQDLVQLKRILYLYKIVWVYWWNFKDHVWDLERFRESWYVFFKKSYMSQDLVGNHARFFKYFKISIVQDVEQEFALGHTRCALIWLINYMKQRTYMSHLFLAFHSSKE